MKQNKTKTKLNNNITQQNKNQSTKHKTHKSKTQHKTKHWECFKIPISVGWTYTLCLLTEFRNLFCFSVYWMIRFCCAGCLHIITSHIYCQYCVCVWLLFFPSLIIPVIIHDRTSALKRSASKLIKWNDSLMSVLWRDGYEQTSTQDEDCDLCLGLLRNQWAVSPQHFT